MTSKLGYKKKRFCFFSFVCFVLVGCEPDTPKETKVFNKQKVKEQFVKVNKLIVTKEGDEMDYYQKSHKMSFIKTNSGIRYYVYKTSLKGDSIKNDDLIKINYTVSLLDGTECYSSELTGPKEFVVGMENIEDGLHKAVLYLKSGDKALILIPSHFAHGLLGDSKKIPPQSPIIYDIEIVSVKKKLSHN